jgi:hemoglobin-like flavoprotein
MKELKKNPEKADKFKSIDSHDFLISFSDSEKIKKAIENAIKSNKINPEELKKFFNKNNEINNNMPGNQGWVNEIICAKKAVKQTKSWLRVVKKLVNKHCNIVFQERWGMYDHRRNSFSELLPSEKMILDENKEKIKVTMFLDSSGSCYHLAESFFRASESIPRETFNVELFSFDTRVNKIGKDRKIKGGGGTDFSCISKYIDAMVKKPELIFVITDGYGGKFKCTNPNIWAWFLSTSYKSDIPKECKVYSLSDFYDE